MSKDDNGTDDGHDQDITAVSSAHQRIFSNLAVSVQTLASMLHEIARNQDPHLRLRIIEVLTEVGATLDALLETLQNP